MRPVRPAVKTHAEALHAGVVMHAGRPQAGPEQELAAWPQRRSIRSSPNEIAFPPPARSRCRGHFSWATSWPGRRPTRPAPARNPGRGHPPRNPLAPGDPAALPRLRPQPDQRRARSQPRGAGPVPRPGRLATAPRQHRPVHVPPPRRAGPVRRLAACRRHHRGEPARSRRRQPPDARPRRAGRRAHHAQPRVRQALAAV